MCELLGISSLEKVPVNELLKEFFSHSVRHPNGWGMAIFYGDSVSLEKEPTAAYESSYLKNRLVHPFQVRNMIAHIRKATVGNTDFENCHPFVQRDNWGRSWTLAHNGTIFDCPILNPYVHTQEGRTDSERILCHLIAQINAAQLAAGRPLREEERFSLVDGIVCQIAPRNKVNLLIYDGELLYVHTNYRDSLYVQQREGTALFATTPLGRGEWSPVPFTTLCAYRNGERRHVGTNHGKEYVDDPRDFRFLFQDYSEL
jgi:glutamine amidotransferase